MSKTVTFTEDMSAKHFMELMDIYLGNTAVQRIEDHMLRHGHLTDKNMSKRFEVTLIVNEITGNEL